MQLTTRISAGLPVGADALKRELNEPALPAAPPAQGALCLPRARPLDLESFTDQPLVVTSWLHPLEPTHRHAHIAAVPCKPRRRFAHLLRPFSDAVVRSQNRVVCASWCQWFAMTRRAVVEEEEVLIDEADVEREQGEAGGHVEVGDAACLVAGDGDGGGLDGHHQRGVLVGDVVDAVQVVPERASEVGTAAVACQREGREAAVHRLQAEERERVGDVQVPACRRRAAPVGVGGGSSG